MTKNVNNVLEVPVLPPELDQNAQWLSGEGCGSWFVLEVTGNNYLISRYSPQGKLECRGIFELLSEHSFDANLEYEFTYLSHCNEVNIIQRKIRFTFKLSSRT